MNSRFSGRSGFGSWFGKRAVRLEEAADGVDREPVEHRREHRAGHPVRRVDHDAQRPDRLDVDEGEDAVDEGRVDVVLASTSPRPAAARAEAALGAVADVEEARVAADRQRAAADDLHPRVLLRVVRGGDGDAAVETELADGEVDHLGADHPDVEDVGAAVGRALDERRGHRGRGDAHVAADGDPLRLELLRVARPIAYAPSSSSSAG